MKNYIYFIFTLILLSCSAKPEPVQNNASQLNLPPNDLIENNILNTDITVALELIDIKKIERQSWGYSSYEVGAKVIKIYIGNSINEDDIISYFGSGESAILKEYLKNRIGKKYIISFAKKGNNFYIPDNGYEFAYSDELDRRIETIIEKIKKKT